MALLGVVLAGSVITGACGTVGMGTASTSKPETITVTPSKAVPHVNAVASAFVVTLAKDLKINPKRILMNQVPPGIRGVQAYLDSGNQNDQFFGPETYVSYTGNMSVKSLNEVGQTQVDSSRLAAQAVYQSMTQRKIILQQLHASQNIYFDYGVSKNGKLFVFVIWWETN